jgi:beta-aspartyl-peptidase (threonine type)
MENRTEGGFAVAAICAMVILLLLVGGGGVGFYFVWRQQMELALQAERVAAAEAEARMQAERSRADAAAATAALRAASHDNPAAVADDDSIRTAVEAILRAQEEAWNQGDLEAFMEHYWQSESLTFSSEGKTTTGWNETLQRYRERYATQEAMGRLTLSELQITPLGDSAALVLGKWKVQRAREPLSGNFSLVVRKFDNRWLIVHDHTSRTME